MQQPLEELKKKKSAIAQITLLFLIQWLSITVIILNALALKASKNSNHGLIMAFDAGLQDYILLIMGAASLFAVSILLCLYLQMFFRLLGNYPMSPSKKILGTEIVFSASIVVSWIAATAIITRHFNESSACRKINISALSTKISSVDNQNNKLGFSAACNLLDAMIIIAFLTIALWFVTLIVSIYSLLRVCGGGALVGDVFNRVPIIIHPYENVSKIQIVSQRSSAYDTVTRIHQQQSQQPTIAASIDDNTEQKQRQESDIIVISKPLMTSMDKQIPPAVVTIATSTNTPPPPSHSNTKSAFSPLPQKQQRYSLKVEESWSQQFDTLRQQQQQQQQHDNLIFLTENHLLQLPDEARIHDTFDFDFNFEPIQVDLMLPSTSELIGSKKRRNYYYS